MAQTSRHISIGKSPDFVMTRGEIEINHQAVLKVYRIDSSSPVLIDSRAPFDRSLAVVIEQLKQKLVAYSWDDRSYVSTNESAPALVIIVTGTYMLSLTYKLEPKLAQQYQNRLTSEFRNSFERNSPDNNSR